MESKLAADAWCTCSQYATGV